MARGWVLVTLSIASPLLWLFWPAIVGDQCIGLRDAGHYYFRLFQWNQQQWETGRVPLWNPQENGGSAHVSDTTTSVFYPLKLVLALPLLSFPARMALYTVIHLALAGVGVYGCGRQHGLGKTASLLGALAYMLCGPVLMSCTNIVFLVGAAWLPVAMIAIRSVLVHRRRRAAFGLAMVMAVMVLGGDPQAAYHTMLIAGLYWMVLGRQSSGAPLATPDDSRAEINTTFGELTRSRPVLLVLAGVAGFCLAAIQILPANQAAQRSNRAYYSVPRTVYEIPPYLARSSQDHHAASSAGVWHGLVGKPVTGTHHDHIYQFSLPPWSVLDMLWPNFSGQPYPIHQRWTQGIPASDRVWVPSLYLGLLPVLLGLSCFSLRATDRTVRWWSWTALLFLVASFGWYGLGWLIREIGNGIFGANGDAIPIGSPTGGLYWVMVTLLPGYAYFRFPAKLIVVSMLAFSLLAAQGCQRLSENRLPRLRWLCWGVGGVSLLLFISCLLCHQVLTNEFSRQAADPLFGTLDATAAVRGLRTAFIWTAVLCGASVGLCRWIQLKSWTPLASLLVVTVTAAELLGAHHWILGWVPRDALNPTASLLSAAPTATITAESSSPNRRIYRGSLQNWLPDHWKSTHSPARVAEIVRWENQTAYPKHHLVGPWSQIDSHCSLTLQDHLATLTAARRHGFIRPDRVAEPACLWLQALSVEYVILPKGAGANEPLLKPVTSPSADTNQDATLYRVTHPYPRAWIVHQIQQVRPLETRDPNAVVDYSLQVLFPAGHCRDFQTQSVVETEKPLPANHSPLNRADESCQIVTADAHRVIIQAELSAAGLLVLNDTYDPDWVARVKSADDDSGYRTVPVLRTNRIMRGVYLPPGRHLVEMTYRPRMVYLGAIISMGSWVLVLGATLFGVYRSRRRQLAA